MTRDGIIFMMTQAPTTEQIESMVNEYLEETTGQKHSWSLPNMNHPNMRAVAEANVLVPEAMEYFQKKFHVNILHDQNGRPIKIY